MKNNLRTLIFFVVGVLVGYFISNLGLVGKNQEGASISSGATKSVVSNLSSCLKANSLKKDAQIACYMLEAQKMAKQFFIANASYQGVCADVSVMVNVNGANNLGPSANNITCGSDTDSYYAIANLNQIPKKFCVDSIGFGGSQNTNADTVNMDCTP